MRKISTLIALLFSVIISIAQTNPTAQSLPYTQNFGSLTAAVTTYPDGWQGWTVSTTPGATFNTAAPTADRVLATGTASSTAGNVYNYVDKIGFLNTASLDLSVVLASSITATVTPINDNIAEAVKNIQLDISNVSGGYILGTSIASINLFDDDLSHVSLTGGIYSQNFNSLGNSGTGSLFNLPTGWTFAESGTGTNTSYTANNGGSTSGDTYSFGTGTNTDRALGTLQTNAFVSTIGDHLPITLVLTLQN